MADRTFIDKQYTLVKGQVSLYCAVSVGALGAVTLQRWNYPQMGQTGGSARTYTAAPTTGGGASFPLTAAQGAEGIFSVARTGTGLWTVTFQNAYQRLIGIKFYSSLAGGLSTITAIHENTTITNMNSGSPPRSVIGLTLMSGTATAADPASGERMNLEFTLQNNTEP
jgi:hypothetical protein